MRVLQSTIERVFPKQCIQIRALCASTRNHCSLAGDPKRQCVKLLYKTLLAVNLRLLIGLQDGTLALSLFENLDCEARARLHALAINSVGKQGYQQLAINKVWQQGSLAALMRRHVTISQLLAQLLDALGVVV